MHLFCYRKRIPSVLVAEDARGTGFTYTLGTGGFPAYLRAQPVPVNQEQKKVTSGYATSLEEYSIAPADMGIDRSIRDFLEEEIESGFRRYIGMGGYLDDVYESVMKPFIRSLP